MSHTLCSKYHEKNFPHKSRLFLGDMKILMQKKKGCIFKTISFMWICFANMYDDLHSKKNPLVNNIDFSFTQRSAKQKKSL